MKIAIINIPIRASWLGENAWITVPPQGYGGIQWVVATFIDGFLELGHEILLLGAPGSLSNNNSYKIIPAGEEKDILEWLQTNQIDIIHDSSNGIVPLDRLIPHRSYISTHHFTGKANNPTNTVYLSNAQKKQAKASQSAPVIRIPVNLNRYVFQSVKQDYLLFLGRISKWKGALEAARLSKIIGLPLVLAGPAWEPKYIRQIQLEFGETVKFVGEVSGEERLNLISNARAVLVMSRTVPGPWGDEWCEPGATVVSEAAASGTPVISTDNGCLAEITPKVGYVLPERELQNLEQWRDVLSLLPAADEIRETALQEWGHIKIAKQYEILFNDVIRGAKWS